ncbi:hypothetical protein ACFRKB_01755 [Streptomyces scopuliridis]|uniref:hypothetical protein n=1 Tax=Streptomyces scopuliridis TaxID=452529 RepID=UPI0036760EDD
MAIELELPVDVAELVPYLRDVLHGAAPVLLEDLIEQASAKIRCQFPAVDPLTTLRRALN